MPVEVNESTWPIVSLRIQGTLSHKEEDHFIETSVSFPLRHERYVAIIHLLEAATPSARFVRGQACAQRDRRTELEEFCAGVVFVIGSAMLRGALRAILHLQGLPSPHVVVETEEAAQAWARAQMQADDVSQ